MYFFPSWPEDKISQDDLDDSDDIGQRTKHSKNNVHWK